MESDAAIICLTCRQPIAAEEEAVSCPECHAPHHRRCWESHAGCAMPGCPANPASRAQMPVAAPPPPMGAVPVTTGQPPSNGLAIASLVLGILGFCTAGITSIIGLILGIVALNNIKRDPRLAGGKGMAVAGVVVSAVLTPIILITVLASVMFPVFAKARVSARQVQCISNQKQIALGIQMYAQDHGQYPGRDWVTKVSPYLGGSQMMFTCPSDESGESEGVSYGYSAALTYPDGTGVMDEFVVSPSEVGATCDATPSQAYPAGGLIGDGATPESRHSRGIVVSYCDGHAKYIQDNLASADESSEVYRIFYRPREEGWLK